MRCADRLHLPVPRPGRTSYKAGSALAATAGRVCDRYSWWAIIASRLHWLALGCVAVTGFAALVEAGQVSPSPTPDAHPRARAHDFFPLYSFFMSQIRAGRIPINSMKDSELLLQQPRGQFVCG